MKNGYAHNIKEFLAREYDCHIGDDDVKVIIENAHCHIKENENVGVRAKRIESNPIEKAFHDQWLEENEMKSFLNFGHGTLQDLFIEREHPKGDDKFPYRLNQIHFTEEINSRDRKIVATVIQWLGTNCGMGFLHQALRRVNMSIVQDKIANNG